MAKYFLVPRLQMALKSITKAVGIQLQNVTEEPSIILLDSIKLQGSRVISTRGERRVFFCRDSFMITNFPLVIVILRMIFVKKHYSCYNLE